MDCLHVLGCRPLAGRVSASGSKNAALPIMAASILANGPVRLAGVPHLADVNTLALLLGHLGVAVKRQPDDTLLVETVDAEPTWADYELVRRMRASFCVLGPLVARRGRAAVSLPGGCNIGTRPVDLHLAGLAALGANIRIEHGYVLAEARRLRGATIDLAGPHGSTVTGTANVMSAATLARGRTIIRSAAREPEIVDLGQFLSALGAMIEGLGTDTLEINGVDELAGVDNYRIIPDRIETATLLIAGAITRGRVSVAGARADHLAAVLDALAEAGACITTSANDITIRAANRPRPLKLSAQPYPGLPTDVQAQLTALLALADGTSTIHDTVFPDRFMHVAELNRLGATIARHGSTAIIRGVDQFSGARLTASDLRASAALVLAGLAAHGETIVERLRHLDRGYERLEEKLVTLGANIQRRKEAATSLRTHAVPQIVVTSPRKRDSGIAHSFPRYTF